MRELNLKEMRKVAGGSDCFGIRNHDVAVWRCQIRLQNPPPVSASHIPVPTYQLR